MAMGILASVGVFLASLAVLMLSAKVSVKKVLDLLHHFDLSDTFGGLVVFSISTSFPEFFSHMAASIGILSGSLDRKVASATVLGANIGSDVIQQTLVVGIVILIMGGVVFEKDFLKTAYAPMIGTTLMCLVLGWDGNYSRWDGLILFGTFIAYLIFLYRRDKSHVHEQVESKEKPEDVNLWMDTVVGLLCLFFMLLSAHFLLSSVQGIVEFTGLGGSIIGVVTLGVASASPELFTAIFGLKEGASGLSLGTLIGSNITNPLFAIGSGALLSTYWVPDPLIYWDLPMETITAALLLLYLLFKSEGKLGRKGALYLIGLYVAYLVIRFMYFSADTMPVG